MISTQPFPHSGVESAPQESAAKTPAVEPSPAAQPVQKEVGGRDGPEPTRYGDWEKNGRCIDF